jgi:hypothetical protein
MSSQTIDIFANLDKNLKTVGTALVEKVKVRNLTA